MVGSDAAARALDKGAGALRVRFGCLLQNDPHLPLVTGPLFSPFFCRKFLIKMVFLIRHAKSLLLQWWHAIMLQSSSCLPWLFLTAKPYHHVLQMEKFRGRDTGSRQRAGLTKCYLTVGSLTFFFKYYAP